MNYESRIMEQAILDRRQKVLYDEKWIKFRRRTWPFRFIPFVELALAAGSMAIGNVNPKSDFDVIVAAKTGRIFTARAFAILFFGLLGWRRKKLHTASVGQSVSYANATVNKFQKNSPTHQSTNPLTTDKICLNHFVTARAYRLSGPHDRYWQTLYKNLVPVFGPPDKVNDFLIANNDWIGEALIYGDDLRHLYRTSSALKILAEKFLAGWLGDRLEGFLKNIQIRRIERSLANDPPGYQPRIIYNDNELEFHPDTKRIELLRDKL